MLMRDIVRWRLLLATGDIRRGSVFLTFSHIPLTENISANFFPLPVAQPSAS